MERGEIRLDSQRRGLIQVFRAAQAVAEAGYRVSVPSEELAWWDYASKWFDLPYALDRGEGPSAQLHVDHTLPEVSLGSLSRPLLFPHAVINRFRERSTEKPVLVSFAGKMTKTRKRVLREWRSRQLPRSGRLFRGGRSVAVVKHSSRGRSWPGKAWDQDYANLLSSSCFVLCPDGDFVWTYRFFEAAMAGAIPIIEHDCDLYQGFHFARMSDDFQSLDWSPSIVKQNFERVRELVTAPASELQLAVEEAMHQTQDGA